MTNSLKEIAGTLTALSNDFNRNEIESYRLMGSLKFDYKKNNKQFYTKVQDNSVIIVTKGIKMSLNTSKKKIKLDNQVKMQLDLFFNLYYDKIIINGFGLISRLISKTHVQDFLKLLIKEKPIESLGFPPSVSEQLMNGITNLCYNGISPIIKIEEPEGSSRIRLYKILKDHYVLASKYSAFLPETADNIHIFDKETLFNILRLIFERLALDHVMTVDDTRWNDTEENLLSYIENYQQTFSLHVGGENDYADTDRDTDDDESSSDEDMDSDDD